MADNFEKSLAYVKEHEGGYSDDPNDKGGPTQNGITQKVYTAYLARKGRQPKPVREITRREVDDIYRTQYWDAINGDDLPSGVDYATFDFAVHSGVGRAIKELQASIGSRMDAHLGTVTLDNLDAADPAETIRKLCDRRRRFIRKLSNYRYFKRGWERRIDEVERTALTMVEHRRSVFSLVDGEVGMGKAVDEDVRITASMTGKGAATSTIGVLGSTVTDLTDRVSDLADYSDTLRWVFIGLVVLGIGITAYGVFRNRHVE